MDLAIFEGWYFYLFIFLMGLTLGSFLNSWIWRRWENVRIVAGRSICIHCRRQLYWFENIPLLSFMWLGGRCRTCRRSISWHYPALELFMAVALVVIAWYRVNYGLFTPWLFFRDVFYITFLTVIFTFDALHQVILPGVVWIGAVIGLLLNVLVFHYSLIALGLAALTAGGFFGLQYLVSRGRWIGGGDVRLGVMMGFWVGWPSILIALFIAYILGASIGVILLITKKKQWNSALPFGTFLCVGTLFGTYFDSNFIAWFLNFYK
ncbi:MAG: prepilin peptidase [bacterium]|nr:prepilin peptidase [bacterium]